MSGAGPADWTHGARRLLVWSCSSCGATWYLPRQHCPTCHCAHMRAVPVAGRGRCVARTTVTPLDGGSSYALVLVELVEGPTLMGRARDAVSPGDRVRAGFETVDGVLVPVFETWTPDGSAGTG